MKSVFSGIKKHWLSLIFLFAAIYIMYLIYYFSSQVAEVSSELSKSVCETIAEVVSGFKKYESPEEKLAAVDAMIPIVRKLAHFSIFATLAFFSHLSLTAFSHEKKSNRPFYFRIFITAPFCFLYAVSDELHQKFVGGRSCEFRDVMIDFSGAILGIFVAMFLSQLVIKFYRKKHSTKSK